MVEWAFPAVEESAQSLSKFISGSVKTTEWLCGPIVDVFVSTFSSESSKLLSVLIS
jgi:hypothetical protein